MHKKSSNIIISWLESTPFGYLKKSVDEFLKTRADSNSNCGDNISIIKFSEQAVTIVSKEKLTKKFKVDLDLKPLGAGTNFNLAFKEAARIAELKSPNQS